MITIFEADYKNPTHATSIIEVLNSYSMDKMGLESPLSNFVKQNLVKELAQIPNAFSILALDGDKACGLANCFIGFSTFKAKKLINIHDLAVLPEARNRGIGTKLLDQIERKARSLDCCKITLEVRDDNQAKNLYTRFGFKSSTPEFLYWAKDLD